MRPLTTSHFFFIGLLLLAFGCHHATEPSVGAKNPRTYIWTIDTLRYPGSWQIVMEGIWGSSASDVYVVGHNDAGSGKMFHFDGHSWQAVKLNAMEGGLIHGAIDLHAIYGFGKNDIYAVGERIYSNLFPPPNFFDSSLVIHYDGVSWREIPLVRSGPFRALWGLWGSSLTDLWAAGLSGTLIHITGTSATVASSPDSCHFQRVAGASASDVCALGFKRDTGPRHSQSYYLWRYNGGSWSLSDEFIYTGNSTDKFGTAWLGTIEGTLYSSGEGFFRHSGGIPERLFFDPQVPAIIGFYGRSANNIFLAGSTGGLFHYNGVDYYRYGQFQGLPYDLYRVWTDGTEVFVIGQDGLKTYILHGK